MNNIYISRGNILFLLYQPFYNSIIDYITEISFNIL